GVLRKCPLTKKTACASSSFNVFAISNPYLSGASSIVNNTTSSFISSLIGEIDQSSFSLYLGSLSFSKLLWSLFTAISLLFSLLFSFFVSLSCCVSCDSSEVSGVDVQATNKIIVQKRIV